MPDFTGSVTSFVGFSFKSTALAATPGIFAPDLDGFAVRGIHPGNFRVHRTAEAGAIFLGRRRDRHRAQQCKGEENSGRLPLEPSFASWCLL